MKTNKEIYKDAFLNLHSKYEFNPKKCNKKEKTIIKPVYFTVAGAVLCMLILIGIGFFQTNNRTNFNLEVNAKTLLPGKFLLASKDPFNQGASFSERENGKGVSYSIEAPITCKGENIKNITYSVNKGAFQVISAKNEHIVTKSKNIKSMNVPIVGGFWDGEESSVIENYCKEFTVNYNKQTSKRFQVNLCGINNDINPKEFLEVHSEIKAKTEMNKLLNGIKITCRVTYNNGKIEEKTIKLFAKIKKYNNQKMPVIFYELEK